MARSDRSRTFNKSSSVMALRRAWKLLKKLATASATAFFSGPYCVWPIHSALTSSCGWSVKIAKSCSKLVIPGWFSQSKLITPSESVVADMIFLRACSSVSFRLIFDFWSSELLLIFLCGLVKLRMRKPLSRLINSVCLAVESGTVNNSPNLLFMRMAMSRVISRCWNWSSPTGT